MSLKLCLLFSINLNFVFILKNFYWFILKFTDSFLCLPHFVIELIYWDWFFSFLVIIFFSSKTSIWLLLDRKWYIWAISMFQSDCFFSCMYRFSLLCIGWVLSSCILDILNTILWNSFCLISVGNINYILKQVIILVGFRLKVLTIHLWFRISMPVQFSKA